MDNHNPLLNISDLSVHYGRPDKLALDNVSLSVFDGEIVALIGPNGAGKSTVLKAIFKDACVSQGKIIYKGQDVGSLSVSSLVSTGIGYVAEGRRLFRKMTVDENLDMGGFIIKDRKQFNINKEKVYKLFPSLYERKKQPVKTLSGGEQQMLAFGRAMMTEPKLLLLDEPSLGLAPKIIDQIFDSISKIKEMGVSFLLVEQNVKKALEVSDRVYSLNLGTVAFCGTPKQILETENLKELYMGDYYKDQRDQNQYVDALLELAAPSHEDLALVIEKGYATVSIGLGDLVNEVYAIDSNGSAFYVKENQKKVDKIIAHQGGALSFNVKYHEIKPEDISREFPAMYFDIIVLWGALHHFNNYEKAMEGILEVCKPGGKLIIFDAFFPEQIREFWERASTIHDPTTVHHHTYIEYMEILRQFKFNPIKILPFRHRNRLDKWLSTIGGDENKIAEEIRILHPGKYDLWLEDALKKGLRQTLRDEITNLDDEMKTHMSIETKGNNEWEFTYDTFVLMAEKLAQKGK